MDATARSRILDLFTLAIADGFVSPEELTLIYEKGKELGLSQADVDQAIQSPQDVSFQAPATLVDAITRLYDLAQVLLSDGLVDHRELDVMRAFATRFGIQDRLIDQIVANLVEEARAETPRDKLVSALVEEVGR